jgi:nucleotide-binding universal stress UspA family protein
MDAKGRPTILVGVSGSTASVAALRWAAQEARTRRGRLQVMLIWHSEQRAFYAYQAGLPDAQDQRDSALQALAETISAALGPGPRPNATAQVVEGTAERVLVAESAAASLLVLGSGSGRTIGPVVRTCVTEALCPVVVVSDRAAPGGNAQWSRRPPADGAARRALSRRSVAAASVMSRVPRPRLAE